MNREYYRIDILTESGEFVRGNPDKEEYATLEEAESALAEKRAASEVEYRLMKIAEEPLYR